MKDSIYNNILTIEGKHTVIFNSFSGKFTILRDNTSIDRKTKLSDFVKEHPAYLEIFKSNNILVEDDIPISTTPSISSISTPQPIATSIAGIATKTMSRGQR